MNNIATLSNAPIKFKTRVRFNGKILYVKMPESMRGQRFECYYSSGKLIVARGEGVVVGTCSGDTWLQFGRKWADGMPKCSLTADVEMKDGQFIIEIQSMLVAEKVRESIPVPIKGDSKMSAVTAIKYLNNFAENNGYDFEIKNGQISLVKIERIG